jgi:hypothetical protein
VVGFAEQLHRLCESSALRKRYATLRLYSRSVNEVDSVSYKTFFFLGESVKPVQNPTSMMECDSNPDEERRRKT